MGDNASTYPTAVIILGLVEHLKSNLIAENDRNKVITSIKKSVLWLLNTKHTGNSTNQWSDCPDQPQGQQTQSVGLDGIVIYTLHSVSKLEEFQTIPNFEDSLKQIDSAWLAKFDQFQFPSLENEVGCMCRTTVNDGEILLDTTKQGDIPWAIIASVEAYPHGSDWQKAVINKWLGTFSFSQEYNGVYYGAAEYLIALTYLRRNISS